MDKKRIEIIITVVLVAILVFVWSGFLKAGKKGPSSVTSASAINAVLAPGSKGAPVAEVVNEKQKWDGLNWARCPFSGKMYVVSADRTLQIKLEGIIWDKDSPLAMINGRVVKKGDRVGANRIIEIKQDSVVVNDGEKDITIKVGR